MTVRTPEGRLLASISLDLDNLWSYMKTYGDSRWTSLPTYLPVVVPRVLEMFNSFGMSGTIFVVGQDTEVDENADALLSIAVAGLEIANHSFHHEPWLHEYSRDRIVDELARTEEGLSAVTGKHPTGFRGPGYSMSPTLLEVLIERGYAYDASTLPTWIGPLARAYYFRSAKLSPDERQQRARLFGRARDGLRPVHPYRWYDQGGGLIELPVTTMPILRIPMHFSYVLYLHGLSPKLARTYFSSALRACALRGLGPSLLLHPLDLLDSADAPGVGFFPGMGLPATTKRSVIDWCLNEMAERFRVVSVHEHAGALATTNLREIALADD